MTFRWLVLLGGLHVLLAGVLAAALVGGWGFGWHALAHAALFVPLAVVVAPALAASARPGERPAPDDTPHRRDLPGGRRALGIVLGAAVLGRLLLLPADPVLSGDAYRMAWEGQVVLAGEDPWAHPPDHPALAELAEAHPELRERVGYWKLPAIYPPFAQLFAAAAGWIAPDVTVLKAALLLAEAALVLALVALLRRRGLPLLLVAAYAWNPLVLTEIAGSGHGDVLAIAFLALGLLLLDRGRAAPAAALAALSGMTKFAGFALLPFALLAGRGLRQRLGAAAAAGAVVLLTLLPFLTPERLAGGLGARFAEFGFSLTHYARHWRFNDSLFGLLEAALGPWARPAVLGAVLLLGIALVLRRCPPALALAALAGAAFLLSPVAHPWYLLWMLPFLVLHPERRWLLGAGLTLSLTAVLGYHALWTLPPGADWTLPAWVRVAEYLPVPLAALWFHRRERRAGQPPPSASSRRKWPTASAAA